MINDAIVRLFFFFKQKTAYEMRISDWSSDVCSSDLSGQHTSASSPGVSLCRGYAGRPKSGQPQQARKVDPIGADRLRHVLIGGLGVPHVGDDRRLDAAKLGRIAQDFDPRSDEHTSELQSLMRISYAVFCLKKKKISNAIQNNRIT